MDALKKQERERAYYQANRERILEQRKARRAQKGPRVLTPEQKQRASEQNKSLYAKNAEERKAKAREYYLNNREKVIARSRRYAQENPERQKAWQKAWQDANPEKIVAQRRSRAHQRRVRIYGGKYERFDYYEIFDRDNWVCGICREPIDRNLKWPNQKSVSLDHIVAISNGGDHVRSNVQAAHLSCNIRKGSRGSD